MPDLALTQAWECPACGTQLAFGDGFVSPPVCSAGHAAREMEQVTMGRFEGPSSVPAREEDGDAS